MDFTIDIARPPERVFALIADLPSYPRWLPPSGLYGSTTQVSETPVTLGTTYVDGKQAPLRPLVMRPIRKENLRTLALMKQYLEREERA